MGLLSSIVSVIISITRAKAQRAGFGVPLIVSHSAAWAERVRTYTSLAGVLVDFAATTPEYLAAAAMFAQANPPTKIKIGRAALVPTQRWAITPVASNSTVYKMTLVDTAGAEHVVSITSDSSATVTEIIASLKTAIDLLSLAITVSDQTTYMRIVANTAGAFFSVYADDIDKLGVKQDHADPGIATDLAAIIATDNTWYGLVTLFNSDALVAAAYAWAESNGPRLYCAQSCNTEIFTHALSGGTDVACTLKTAADARSFIFAKAKPHQFADAALFGAVLPLDPGSETWVFKTLAGISADSLTATHSANALAKWATWYEETGGVNITQGGKVGSGDWIDNTRGKDWLTSEIGANVFDLLLANPKTPFTDAGISAVGGAIRAALKKGVRLGFLAESPAPDVVLPKAADVSSSDKTARSLTGVTFSATLAGAVQSTTINGTLTT